MSTNNSNLNDFYFSASAEEREMRFYSTEGKMTLKHVFFNGEWRMYTEMTSHGHKPLNEDSDLTFVCTTSAENIKTKSL